MYSCKRQKTFLLILRGKLKKNSIQKSYIWSTHLYQSWHLQIWYSIVLRIISSCLANYIQPRIYVLIYFDFKNMLLADQHTLVSYIKTENVCRQFGDIFFESIYFISDYILQMYHLVWIPENQMLILNIIQ